MHVPDLFAQKDLATLHALIHDHPLGTWVTFNKGELLANHIPFFLDTTRGEYGTLVGHVARANDVWRSLPSTTESLIVFQGPQTYISPSWYPSKHAHGKAVPTWNYAVVHAHGIPRLIQDSALLLEHLNTLTDVHEAKQAVPWRVSDAPADFIERLTQLIVGIEIPITRLVGKWKVNQNRPEPDRLGVVAGLQMREETNAAEMAALVRQHIGLL